MSQLEPREVAQNIKQRYEFDNLDALVVLGAVFECDQQTRSWQSPPFIKHYEGLHVAGELRAAAAGVIYHTMAENIRKFLVTGGTDDHPNFKGLKISRSDNLRRLMRDVYGVPDQRTVPIGRAQSSHTMGNFNDLASYMEDHPEQFPLGRVGVLCPRFQAMRAREMADPEGYFSSKGVNFHWLMAERIMEITDPHFIYDYSRKVHTTQQAIFCARKELEGREKNKAGDYQPGQVDEEYERLKMLDFSGENAEYVRIIRASFDQFRASAQLS